jgi:putative membrane protein insertion efficiency factor
MRSALRLPAYAGLGLVYLYRWTLGIYWRGRCKYHPSCSQYALDALREYGLVRGSILAGWRLLRCNPWSRGGVDYVEQQRLFQHRGTQGSPVRPLLLRSARRCREEAPPGQARLRRRLPRATEAGRNR